jgi:PIN domain nuclease of toxin-antitoxin system
MLPHATISAVNFWETIQHLRRGGMPLEAVTLALTPLLADAVTFDRDLAYVAASIHEQTRHKGLSFGDCACLALALSRKVAAVTTEEAWEASDVGVRIIRIR